MMNDSELVAKVNSAIYHQCKKRGYAAPVDVLLDIGVLSKEKYEAPTTALYEFVN